MLGIQWSRRSRRPRGYCWHAMVLEWHGTVPLLIHSCTEYAGAIESFCAIGCRCSSNVSAAVTYFDGQI